MRYSYDATNDIWVIGPETNSSKTLESGTAAELRHPETHSLEQWGVSPRPAAHWTFRQFLGYGAFTFVAAFVITVIACL